MIPRSILIVIFLLHIHSISVLGAEPPQQQTAQQLSKKAYRAYVNKSYKQALLLYKDAYNSQPNPGTLLAIALCHEKLKNYNIALKIGKRALSQSKSSAALTKRLTTFNARMRTLIAQQQEANALHQKGIDLYTMANFSASAAAHLKAYNVLPKAIYLHDAARARQKAGQHQSALALAERAKTQQSDPLNQSQTAQNNQLIQTLKQTIEQLQWTTKRVDWKTYTGIGAMTVGTTMIAIAFGYFGRTARQNADNAKTLSKEAHAESKKDTERLQSQGLAVLSVGSLLTLTGATLVVWDLSTIERVRKTTTPTNPVSVRMTPQRLSLTVEF